MKRVFYLVEYKVDYKTSSRRTKELLQWEAASYYGDCIRQGYVSAKIFKCDDTGNEQLIEETHFDLKTEMENRCDHLESI